MDAWVFNRTFISFACHKWLNFICFFPIVYAVQVTGTAVDVHESIATWIRSIQVIKTRVKLYLLIISNVPFHSQQITGQVSSPAIRRVRSFVIFIVIVRRSFYQHTYHLICNCLLRYQVTIPDKLGLIQAYLLAINRINHSRVSTQQLYEKLYELESNALEIVSPLHRLTTLNKYGRVTLNYLSPNVQKGEYPPLSQSPFTQHNNAGDKMK